MADLRAWLACVELVARRCALQRGRNRHFRFEELQSLVGAPGVAQLRRSIARLESSGLLAWSESAIRIDVGPGSAGTVAGICPKLLGRKVPVPRRIIRHLAAGSSRAIVATVFAHLIRCLHYRDGQCVSGGFCKASWVSETFGVHVRNVKAARQQLIRLGWLIPATCPQRVMNGLGMGMEINLLWASGSSGARRADSAPPILLCVSGTPPLRRNMKLSSRPETHKPSEDGGTGSRVGPAVLAAPTLRNVVEADLGDDRRLSTLFAQAIERKWVSDCSSDRLNFWAAAEHARAIGQRNLPGLFVFLVKHRRWGFITQRDEDRARSRIVGAAPRLGQQVYHGVPRRGPSSAATICASLLECLKVQQQAQIGQMDRGSAALGSRVSVRARLLNRGTGDSL